jgi:hypothetical protein
MEKIVQLKSTLLSKFLQKTRVTRLLVDFSDFMLFDKIFELLNVSFLKPNIQKWRRINFIASQTIAFIIMILAAIINLILNFKELNLLQIIEIVTFISIFTLIMSRFYITRIYYREDIAETMRHLENLFPTNAIDQLNYETRKYLIVLKHFFITSAIVYCTADIAFLSVPLFLQFQELYRSGVWEVKMVALNIYFPIDIKHPGVNEIFTILLTWTTIMLVLLMLAMDYLFCCLIQLITMGVNNLANSLEKIDLRNDEEAIYALKEIIKIQNVYLEMTKKIERIYSFSLFLNLFAVIEILCGMAFLTVVGQELSTYF